MYSPSYAELQIERLGENTIDSPLANGNRRFVNENKRIVVSPELIETNDNDKGYEPSFEIAGARKKIFFPPNDTSIGIVTCGGLCPGLNEVIRSITLSASNIYGVKRIVGFRYGYHGLSNKAETPINLTETSVDGIRGTAGTILGTSRGPQDLNEIIDNLVKHKINILFVIGGDGTLRGASSIANKIKERKLKIGVIALPKTIDNDICWTSMSFGFYTAVEEAKKVIFAAHAEARSAKNGIGLVKLMGRHSGFIATHASRASSVVNFCLIPESPFRLEGSNGFLESLKRRLDKKKHAVIVVSEGAGQDFFVNDKTETDASGNSRLADIGIFLKESIIDYFNGMNFPFTLKYIDPSYIIRSAPADTMDAELCMLLGTFAVHAGMAGRTNTMIGLWNQNFVHVPIPLAIRERKIVQRSDERWHSLIDITRQPEMA